VREIYFHEDEYGQLELVPEANWSFLVKTMQAAQEFSDAHRAGVGWTEIFSIPQPPIPLLELKIRRSHLLKAVNGILPPFDRVLSGYGSQATECEHTWAFGAHSSLAMFVEFDEDLVKTAWFTFDLRSQDDATTALILCRALAQWPVVLADWGWNRLYRITDEPALAQYFRDRVDVFGKSR